MSELKGVQIRAARAMLKWRAEDLAERAKLGVATIRRAEAFDGSTTLTPANADAVRRAFEAEGIIFNDNPEVPGVAIAIWQRSIFD